MVPRFNPPTSAFLIGAALLLLICLSACSSKPEAPRYYDEGLHVPTAFDPSEIPNSPSRTLPARDSSIDSWAARFSLEPRTEHVPLTSVFETPGDILATTDIAATLAALRQLASATPEYHQELLDIIEAAESVDAAHLELVINAAYYTEKTRAHMEQVASGLVRRPDALSQLQREAIIKNLNRAQVLGALANRILAQGLAKATDLTAATALALLEKTVVQQPEAEEAIAAITAYTARFQELDPLELRALIEMAKRKRSFAIASDLAYRWFSDGHTVRELVVLMQGFPPGEALDSLIAASAADLREATVEAVRTLAHALYAESAIVETAPKLLAALPSLTATDLKQIAGAITAGSPRDKVIIGAIKLLKEVTPRQSDSLLALFHLPENRAKAAKALKGKIRGTKN